MTDGEIEDFIKSCNLKSFASVEGKDIFNHNELIADDVDDIMESYCAKYDVDDATFEVHYLDMSKISPIQLRALADYRMYDETLDSDLSEELKGIKMHTADIMKDVHVDTTIVTSYKDFKITRKVG